MDAATSGKQFEVRFRVLKDAVQLSDANFCCAQGWTSRLSDGNSERLGRTACAAFLSHCQDLTGSLLHRKAGREEMWFKESVNVSSSF